MNIRNTVANWLRRLADRIAYPLAVVYAPPVVERGVINLASAGDLRIGDLCGVNDIGAACPLSLSTCGVAGCVVAIDGDSAQVQIDFPFGYIPHEMKCARCREFDFDGCPACPGFGGYD
jgi:hypothetical protein